MPASSRKRNKGKERKVRQQAKKEENERAEAHQYWWSFYGCISNPQCYHGHGLALMILPSDNPVSNFMDQFYINLRDGMTVSQNLRELFKSQRLMWTTENYRKLVVDILLRIGTNLMIRFGTDVDVSCVAQSIVVLEHYEHYDGSGDIDLVLNKQVVCSKNRDMSINVSSGKRDALKFYRKRVSCKCLKKMHLEARKSTPKMGLCWHCKDERERVHLSVCSMCMVSQYCSRECQVADWPRHEVVCGVYANDNYYYYY